MKTRCCSRPWKWKLGENSRPLAVFKLKIHWGSKVSWKLSCVVRPDEAKAQAPAQFNTEADVVLWAPLLGAYSTVPLKQRVNRIAQPREKTLAPRPKDSQDPTTHKRSDGVVFSRFFMTHLFCSKKQFAISPHQACFSIGSFWLRIVAEKRYANMSTVFWWVS